MKKALRVAQTFHTNVYNEIGAQSKYPVYLNIQFRNQTTRKTTPKLSAV